MAILSQAGSTLPEGAETTWELIGLVYNDQVFLITGESVPRPGN